MESSPITITKQESIGKKLYSKNEVCKEAHYVAKTQGFLIELVTSFDVHRSKFHASLIYDTDSYEDIKPVEVAKVTPLTYRAFPQDSNRIVFEFKVHVLSSQLSESLFKIRIDAEDSTANVAWTVFSESIRVLSKPSQVLKELGRDSTKPATSNRGKRAAPSPSTPVSSVPTAPVSIPSATTPSLPLTTDSNVMSAILTSLSRVEEQLKKHDDRLNQLTSLNLSVEDAFRATLSAWSKLNSAERPAKMRKMLSSLATEEKENLDNFASSMNESSNGALTISTTGSTSTCTDFCPHQLELEKWASFFQTDAQQF